MNVPFKISAGELFELIWPVTLIVSALISTWVLFSAQKRYRLYIAFLWTIAALILPLIAVPLYLMILITTSRPSNNNSRSLQFGWATKLGIPLIYGVVTLLAIAIYLRMDARSVDSHLFRANQARVNNDRTTTIREYKEALAIENDAHTHKLLAIELAEAGRSSEALAEFRLAADGGEPDDTIHYQMAELMDKMNLGKEALVEYRLFLVSSLCLSTNDNGRCSAAKAKVQAGKLP